MREIHDREGNLIATIHDEEKFLELLNRFEDCRWICDTYRIMRRFSGTIITGHDVAENVLAAAAEMRKIRQQFGDERPNLYPVDTSGSR